jgi:protein-glucosylgalactosylhydroxylysine glucosidase
MFRYPWESGATGIEVVQPGYEYIAKYQQHISGDIAFAVQFYLSLTHDVDFMTREGCKLAKEIAEFWESRVEFNKWSHLYDINSTMGPDEDHININNNVYTNVIAKKALLFGS